MQHKKIVSLLLITLPLLTQGQPATATSAPVGVNEKLLNAASTFVSAGNLDEAETTYEKLIQLNPKSIEAYSGLYKIGMLAGNAQLAIRAKKALIQLRGFNVWDYNDLASVQLAAGDYLGAKQISEKALSLSRTLIDKNDRSAQIFLPKFHSTLAQALHGLGNNTKAALNEFELAESLSQKYPSFVSGIEINSSVADFYASEQNWTQSKKYYLLATLPDEEKTLPPLSLMSIAGIEIKLGNLTKAAEFYDRLRKEWPSDPVAYYGLAAIHELKTNEGASAELFKLGTQLDQNAERKRVITNHLHKLNQLSDVISILVPPAVSHADWRYEVLQSSGRLPLYRYRGKLFDRDMRRHWELRLTTKQAGYPTCFGGCVMQVEELDPAPSRDN